jgi:hypothetical protein
MFPWFCVLGNAEIMAVSTTRTHLVSLCVGLATSFTNCHPWESKWNYIPEFLVRIHVLAEYTLDSVKGVLEL